MLLMVGLGTLAYDDDIAVAVSYGGDMAKEAFGDDIVTKVALLMTL